MNNGGFKYDKKEEVLRLTIDPKKFDGCPWSHVRDILSRPCWDCEFASFRSGGCPEYETFLNVLSEYDAK